MRRKILSHDGFSLILGDSIPWKKLPDRGYFAVYDTMPEWGSRLFIVQGLGALRNKIDSYIQNQMISTSIWVETAATEKDLPDPPYIRSVREVLRGVELIKKRGDKTTLRRVRAALESKGERPGPKTDHEKHEWLIPVLRELAAGKPLKQIQFPRPWKSPSVSAKLSKFCWEFFNLCTLLNVNLTNECPDARVSAILSERFGFIFPADLEAANEAFRRGQESLDRALRTSGKHRFTPPPARFSLFQI